MVEIPDSLRSQFSATIEEQDGTYVVEVPSSEVAQKALTTNETYRVAILAPPFSTASSTQQAPQNTSSRETVSRAPSGPPVDEGEVRDVTIETVGDQGDGIAKVERGYVVIVPDTRPGEQPTVEIDQVRENVAFASVVERDSRAG